MKFSTTGFKRLRDAYTNKYEPESLRVLASAYWHALLYVTIFVVLSAACFGLWQFAGVFRTLPESPTLVPSGARAPIINHAQLEATVQGFKDRQERYEYLKVNPPQLADPSR